MQRKSFSRMECPIARGLERVGEWWSMLILRDAFYGMTRFDEFEESLGIAPNMLTRRLSALVEEGLLERVPYMERPRRYEYRLTDRGRDFRPVLLALLAWGNRQFSPEGERVMLIDERTGARVEPVLVDARSGAPITEESHVVAAGPAASKVLQRKVALRAARRAKARETATGRGAG